MADPHPPDAAFERFADDADVLSTSEAQAREALAGITDRMTQVGLTLRPSRGDHAWRAGRAGRKLEPAYLQYYATFFHVWTICNSESEIEQRLVEFLRDELKLELSQEKTLITHARTGAARFLGYEIIIQHNDTKKAGRCRRVNGQVALRVPRDVIKAKSAPYLRRGKPAKQKALTNGSDHTIVATYGAIYRGIVQYYLLAGDVYRLHRLLWVMETSMLTTLAGKHPAPRCRRWRPSTKPDPDATRAAHLLRSTHRTRRQATTGRTVR